MLKPMVVAVLGVCLVGLAGCAELQQQKKQNAALQQQVQGLTSDNEALKAANAKLTSRNDELEAAAAGAGEKAGKDAGLLAELKAEQAKLRKQKEDLAAVVKNIPNMTVEGRSEGNFIVTENKVLFDAGQIELKPEAAAALGKVADYLVAHPQVTIRIDGHTDGQPIKVSKWQDNYELSAMRAHAVMRFLVDKGVKADRVYIAGFGPNRPLVPPKEPEEEVAANRRVEILVIPEGIRSISQILESLKD
jgi:chemotaxis protein MotB